MLAVFTLGTAKEKHGSSGLLRVCVMCSSVIPWTWWQEFKVHVVFSAGPNWSVAFDPKDEAVVRESLTKAGLEAGMLVKSW